MTAPKIDTEARERLSTYRAIFGREERRLPPGEAPRAVLTTCAFLQLVYRTGSPLWLSRHN